MSGDKLFAREHVAGRNRRPTTDEDNAPHATTSRAIAGVCRRHSQNHRRWRWLLTSRALADLGSGFSLVELANVVQLSPRHFSRLFRNSFGTTPYRYVVGE